MVRRQTWFVVGFFVLLAAFAWMFQNYQANKALKTEVPTPTTAKASLYDFDLSAVSQVDIKSADGNQIGLVLDPETSKWIIKDVPAEKADSFQIDSILAQLFSIQIQEVMTQIPPLDSIGLASPVDVITVTKQDGSQVVTDVGTKTAIGSGYYVRTAGNQVAIVSNTTLDTVLGMLTTPPLASTPTPEVTSTELIEPTVTPTP
jgi:hypothetical protein